MLNIMQLHFTASLMMIKAVHGGKVEASICFSINNIINLLLFTALCPSDFVSHPSNGLCYGYVTSPLDWRSAELDCRSRRKGGMLVKISDNTLNDWICDNVLSHIDAR